MRNEAVSLDRFFHSFFSVRASAAAHFRPNHLYFLNNAGFFWNRVERERIFGMSGERTCNSGPDVLGGPDRERAVFLRAAYPSHDQGFN